MLDILKYKLEAIIVLFTLAAFGVNNYNEFQSLKCELWEFKIEIRRSRHKEIINPIYANNREDALSYHQSVVNESIFLTQEIESIKRRLQNCK